MTTFIGHDRHTRYFITDELEAYFHFWRLGFDVKYQTKSGHKKALTLNDVDRLLSQMGMVCNDYKQI